MAYPAPFKGKGKAPVAGKPVPLGSMKGGGPNPMGVKMSKAGGPRPSGSGNTNAGIRYAAKPLPMKSGRKR